MVISFRIIIIDYGEKKMSKRHEMVTLSAEVAVSQMENGMRYVQVMPDDPRVGTVVPFVANGRAQMLSNGTFDFVQRQRIRRKPEYKGDYLSFSRGNDGNDRVYFMTPSELRADMPRLLQKDIAKLLVYLEKMISDKKKRV